jgi:hypothetical protein
MNYQIVKYEDKYKDSIVKLLNKSLGSLSKNSNFNSDYFDWKHLNNPFGKSLMVVAVDDESNVIGFRSFMKWKFNYYENEIVAVRAVDTATDPKCQGKGVFKSLTLEAIGLAKEENQFIFNTPNFNSFPIYLKLGWKLVKKQKFSIYPSNVYSLIKVGLSLFFSYDEQAEPPFNELSEVSLINYTYSIYAGNGTKVTRSYFEWRYIKNPKYKYYECNLTENVLGVFRFNIRKGIPELILIDMLAKPNTEIGNINLKSVLKKSKCAYILMSRETRRYISNKILLDFNEPFVNLVKYDLNGKDNKIFNNFIFPCRDLEVF